MTQQNCNFKIPADSEYLKILGRAFYNFTYLEWIVVHTIVKLSPQGFGIIEANATAAKLAKALYKTIEENERISEQLRGKLRQFHGRFLVAKKERDRLLHSHPLTASCGVQRLGAKPGEIWSTSEVLRVAHLFEDAGIFGNGIYHDNLSKEIS